MRVRPFAMVVLALALSPAPSGVCQDSGSRSKTLKTPLLYRNAEYGFCLALPAGWDGFKVLADHWRGNGNGSEETGPLLIIRNSRWTEDERYQDIPILVFTFEQWHKVDSGEFNVSAAPVGPSELGRNPKYVFALPPRFAGFDDAIGTDEVLQLLSRTPFQAPCSTPRKQP